MKRVCPFVFGIVVLGLFLWTRAYVRQSAVGSVRQLPDGASIEVVAVTYGAQHKVVIGQIWEKLLLHLAPKNFVTNKKLPRIEYKFLTKSRAAVTAQQILYRSETTNSLVFWTIFRKPNDPVDRNIRALTADELGNDYETAQMRVFIHGADYAVVAWELN